MIGIVVVVVSVAGGPPQGHSADLSKRMARAKQEPLREYLRASRSLAVGYIFLVPLLSIYEIGVVFAPSARNGTDPVFLEFFRGFGPWAVPLLNLLLLALLFFCLSRAAPLARRRPGLYATMLFESALWAGVLLVGAELLPPKLLMVPPVIRDSVAAAGAGVYEEVLFRLVLMGGLILVMHRLMDTPKAFCVPVAIGLSAGLFSYAHHALGGEPFDPGVFWFRTIMGGGLGCLFYFRGLGVVVYAHALYNVFLILSSHV